MMISLAHHVHLLVKNVIDQVRDDDDDDKKRAWCNFAAICISRFHSLQDDAWPAVGNELGCYTTKPQRSRQRPPRVMFAYLW